MFTILLSEAFKYPDNHVYFLTRPENLSGFIRASPFISTYRMIKLSQPLFELP